MLAGEKVSSPPPECSLNNALADEKPSNGSFAHLDQVKSFIHHFFPELCYILKQNKDIIFFGKLLERFLSVYSTRMCLLRFITFNKYL